jgi:hypothetical protein
MVQDANAAGLVTSLSTVEEVLHDHAPELGDDLIAYRNHVYRVVNLCLAIAGDGHVEVEKTAVAAVFHDLAIWTNKTFDYIAPSVALAREYLEARGMAAWVPEVAAMIEDHHKIIPARRLDRRVARITTIWPPASIYYRGRRHVAECRFPSTARSADDRSVLEAPPRTAADGQVVTSTVGLP